MVIDWIQRMSMKPGFGAFSMLKSLIPEDGMAMARQEQCIP